MLMIKATIDDLPHIIELYDRCKTSLLKEGIYQWDHEYPNQTMYQVSIEDEELFLFLVKEKIIASVVLAEFQSEEWLTMKWAHTDGNPLVIHALAIDPFYQGLGYGKKALELCETAAIEMGYKFMRLDAFSENKVALKLYENKAYRKVGHVFFENKPKYHQKYYCYEKQLIQSS